MAFGAREAIVITPSASPPSPTHTRLPYLASPTLQIPESAFKTTAAESEEPALPLQEPARFHPEWSVASPSQMSPDSGSPQEHEFAQQAPQNGHSYTMAYPSSRATAITVREIDTEDELDEEEDATTSWEAPGTTWVGGDEEGFAVAIGGPVREVDGYEEGGLWRRMEEVGRSDREEVLRLPEPEVIVVAAAEPLLAKGNEGGGGAVGIAFTLTCVDDGWSGGEVMFDDDFLFEEEIMDPDYFRKKDRQRESVVADMLMKSVPKSLVEESQLGLFELA